MTEKKYTKKEVKQMYDRRMLFAEPDTLETIYNHVFEFVKDLGIKVIE